MCHKKFLKFFSFLAIDFFLGMVYIVTAHQKTFMILQFLKEFSLLSNSEQRVFLYCVEHLPSPHMYSHDLRKIATATGLYYQTVRGALHAISASPVLSAAVQYIRKDVNSPVIVSLDALGEVGSCKRGEEQ